jgi:hypothetical protein
MHTHLPRFEQRLHGPGRDVCSTAVVQKVRDTTHHVATRSGAGETPFTTITTTTTTITTTTPTNVVVAVNESDEGRGIDGKQEARDALEGQA